MEKVLLFAALILCTSALEGPMRLELASLVFRHGDRSPVHMFPTDSYTESDWPQGFGQLSIVGMQQHHHLGTVLRQRYMQNETLIFSNYTRVQVRIRSTDVDRTLMSAESQLSSFFAPDSSQMFDSDLPWQPIPVHTAPVMDDKLLRSTDSCPAFQALLQKAPESDEYKMMTEKYKDFLANVSQHAGMTVNLTNVWTVADTVFIEHVSPGYNEPSWATDEVISTLKNISSFTMAFMFNGTEKNRLSAGPWLEKVLTDMKNKVNPAGNKTLEDMKLFLYSAHDTTLAAMMSALGVYDGDAPGYASVFAIELYSDANSQFYLKMFRRFGPDLDEFVLLNPSYCSNSDYCLLSEFETFVKPLIPADLEAECNNVTGPTTSPTTLPTAPATTSTESKLEEEKKKLVISVIALGSALCAVLLLTIILMVILVSVCCKRRSRSKRIYSALSEES